METDLKRLITSLPVETETGPSGGRYVIRSGDLEAEMTFSRLSPKTIIVDHTGVPDAWRGTGAGNRLAEHAITAAREGGWQIIPLCPFLRALSLKRQDWGDVIRQR